MRKVYLESPYITIIAMLSVILLLVPIIAIGPQRLYLEGDLPIFISLPIIMFFTYVICAPEFFGFVVITPQKVMSIRPCRRIKTIDYADICDIAIDYSVVSGGQRLYSLIISKCRIPGKYMHKVNCIPRKLQREMIIFSYDKKQYQTLFEYLPPRARKLLENCQSSIRLYHLDKE